MAVPDNNIRYTRIETEVNEAIQDHPEIHDELIRYSWSRDSGVGGTYYAGLSHHSLCKTAITYKGFLGMGDGGFPTYGGYSIREFKGYDWEKPWRYILSPRQLQYNYWCHLHQYHQRCLYAVI